MEMGNCPSDPSVYPSMTGMVCSPNLDLNNNIDNTVNGRDEIFGDCGTLRVEDRKDKDFMVNTANNLELFFR